MAKTNRNRKLPLNEAWKHYWSELYPNGVDWRKGLDGEIRKRLYFPGESHDFVGEANPGIHPPPWAHDLEIGFEDGFVEIRIQDSDLVRILLFTDQLIPVLSNWKHKNPLDQAGSLLELTDREKMQCRDFFIAVVRNCGNSIQGRLLGVLKETENPLFEIFCRTEADDSANEGKLSPFAMSKVCRLDIPQNGIRDQMGAERYSHVHLKRRQRKSGKVGPHGSFHQQDEELIEVMKSKIDGNEAKSVRAAAEAVIKNARRRKDAVDDSVLRRLQRKFSERYPNYID